jgi:hypothetical protein
VDHQEVREHQELELLEQVEHLELQFQAPHPQIYFIQDRRLMFQMLMLQEIIMLMV